MGNLFVHIGGALKDLTTGILRSISPAQNSGGIPPEKWEKIVENLPRLQKRESHGFSGLDESSEADLDQYPQDRLIHAFLELKKAAVAVTDKLLDTRDMKLYRQDNGQFIAKRHLPDLKNVPWHEGSSYCTVQVHHLKERGEHLILDTSASYYLLIGQLTGDSQVLNDLVFSFHNDFIMLIERNGDSIEETRIRPERIHPKMKSERTFELIIQDPDAYIQTIDKISTTAKWLTNALRKELEKKVE